MRRKNCNALNTAAGTGHDEITRKLILWAQRVMPETYRRGYSSCKLSSYGVEPSKLTSLSSRLPRLRIMRLYLLITPLTAGDKHISQQAACFVPNESRNLRTSYVAGKGSLGRCALRDGLLSLARRGSSSCSVQRSH